MEAHVSLASERLAAAAGNLHVFAEDAKPTIRSFTKDEAHAPVPGEMLLEEERIDTQKLYRWYRRTASPSCSSFAIIAWALLIRSCSGPLLLPLWVSAIGAI